MALFKILKGLKTNLPSDKKDGYCYFTTDDQMFYIDYLDANNQLQRKPLNANDAKTLLGKGVVETLTNASNAVPTAAAVYVKASSLENLITDNQKNITDLQNKKMDKANPVGTGTLSINRLDSSTIGVNSVAVGTNTTAEGHSSFAEGYGTIAEGNYSHVEGYENSADGVAAHAEGNDTYAEGDYSHAEGKGTHASHDAAHAEGNSTVASGQFSHAEGNGTIANHKSQHVQGEWNIADPSTNAANSRGTYAHIIGNGTSDEARSNALTVKWNGDFWTAGSFANGNATNEAAYSFASGYDATARGAYSHAEGLSVLAEGEASHAEGQETEASGLTSHAEGGGTTASGAVSHAEGYMTTASGDYSHAEGAEAEASGAFSHAEGGGTTASGTFSHAEGSGTLASGDGSHAGGYETAANGLRSFTHGLSLTAEGTNQAVFGKYNAPNTTDIFQIGGGFSDTDRFNAFSITASGVAKIKSSLNIGGAEDNTGLTNLLFVSGRGYFEGGIRTGSNYYPSDNKDLVTKDYVANNLPQLSHVYRTASADGTTSFNFSGDIADLTQNFYLVYFNGLLLVEGVHYTVSGTTVNLLDWSCRANDMCHVVGFKPMSGDVSATNIIATSY